MTSPRAATCIVLPAVLTSALLAGCVASADEHPVAPHAGSAQQPSLEDALPIQEALFRRLSDAGLTCGGIRTAISHGHAALMLPTECFVDESGSATIDAAPRIERIAAALHDVGGVVYQVGAYVPEDTPDALAMTRAQAEAVRTSLIDVGLEAERLVDAVGYGSDFDEEVYDGPATLASGNPLIELAILPEHP
jgi:hypothetical protein